MQACLYHITTCISANITTCRRAHIHLITSLTIQIRLGPDVHVEVVNSRLWYHGPDDAIPHLLAVYVKEPLIEFELPKRVLSLLVAIVAGTQLIIVPIFSQQLTKTILPKHQLSERNINRPNGTN